MSENLSRDELLQRVRELEGQLSSLQHEYELLQDNTSRYEQLIETMPSEVHIWKLVRDEHGAIKTWRLVHANQAALKAWGMKLEDVVGKTTNDAFDDPTATDTFLPMIVRLFEENKPIFWERYFEGTGQILQMLSIPSGEYFFSTGADVTELRRMQETLEHSRKLDAIGELAGGVAHDFNNQLAGILGYAEALEKSLRDPELLEAVRGIESAAERSAALTQQLLAFARSGPATFEAVSVEPLLKEVVALLERTLDRGIVISCKVSAEPAFVKGDRSLLSNALLNLAINARDAMPKGGQLTLDSHTVAIDARTREEQNLQLKDGEYVCIRVTDTGQGIPPNELERIFDPFFTTKGSGNGMGLPSVYGTVTRHGGDIAVESEVGHGACFKIFLPVDTSEPRTTPATTPPDIAIDRALGILVVDDEPALCKLYSLMLSRYGHEVWTFDNGRKAEAFFASHWRDVDIVILDMNMPERNGLDVLTALKAINPKVRAIIATGYGVEAGGNTLLAMGVRHRLQKPFRERTLLAAISDAIS